MKARKVYGVLILTIALSAVVVTPSVVHATPGQWSASDATIFYNDGNVGIGTSTPSDKLHVNGNVITSNVPYFWNGFKSNAIPGVFGFNQSDKFLMGVGSNLYGRGFSGNALGLFNNSTTAEDIFLYNQNSQQSKFFVLKASGRLGLSNENPRTLVEIGRSNYTAESARVAINAPGNLQSALEFSAAGIEDWTILRPANTHDLKIWNGSQGYYNMTFLSNGNVGISTENPQYKLSVNGTIQAKEVRVNTGWSDYVFEDDYELKSLDEVENYIEVNKHLPNIPSAEEVETNGISLGEMQQKQMEKIEELTLYIIQLEKRVRELEGK